MIVRVVTTAVVGTARTLAPIKTARTERRQIGDSKTFTEREKTNAKPIRYENHDRTTDTETD